MEQLTRERIDRLIDAFVNKDLETIMGFFNENAVLNDPHYPVQEMRGKTAIRKGLEWGLGNLVKPGFTIRHCWIEGNTGAIEVDTNHVFKGGMKLRFMQVFIIESRNGKIDRLQSYVPYPPPGIGGLVTKLTRMAWKLRAIKES